MKYPDPPFFFKTFHIKYDKKLSLAAKHIFNSFQKKYIYHAIEDILDSFKSNPVERNNLLSIIYSPVLSLHNTFSIDFFGIYIDEIYIQEISKVNKFLKDNSSDLHHYTYITIKFFCKKPKVPPKQETLW